MTWRSVQNGPADAGTCRDRPWRRTPSRYYRPVSKGLQCLKRRPPYSVPVNENLQQTVLYHCCHHWDGKSWHHIHTVRGFRLNGMRCNWRRFDVKRRREKFNFSWRLLCLGRLQNTRGHNTHWTGQPVGVVNLNTCLIQHRIREIVTMFTSVCSVPAGSCSSPETLMPVARYRHLVSRDHKLLVHAQKKNVSRQPPTHVVTIRGNTGRVDHLGGRVSCAPICTIAAKCPQVLPHIDPTVPACHLTSTQQTLKIQLCLGRILWCTRFSR